MLNQGIALLKTLGCFLVVWIHLGPRGANNPAISFFTDYSDAFCRIAVPIFFVISGYFLFDGCKNISKHLTKISKVTFVALIVYIGPYFLENKSDLSLFNYEKTLKWGGNFILFNNCSPIGSHLWYMFALIYSIGATYLLLKAKISSQNLLAIASLLWLIGICFNYTSFQYMCRSWIFVGLPCVIGGVLLNRGYFQLQPKKCLILILIFQSGIFAEVSFRHSMLLNAGRDMFLSLLPMALFCVAFFKSLSLKHPSWRIPIYIGQKLSGNIYLYHLAVFYLVSMIVSFDSFLMVGLRPFMVFLITCLFLWLHVIIKTSIKNLKSEVTT